MYITGAAAGQTAAAQQSTTNGSNGSNSSESMTSSSGLDSTFTQLLVAQLKSQDPLNPMDPTQFVSHSIGQNTTFNGTTVFAAGSSSASDPNTLTGATGVSLTTTMTTGDTLKITAGGSSYTYSYTSGDTVQNVLNNINGSNLGVTASLVSGKLTLVDQKGRGNVAVDPSSTATEFGAFSNPTGTGVGSLVIYLGDGTSAGHSSISVSLNQFDSSHINGSNLSGDSLLTAAGAQTALTDINTAISNVAALRGTIGAGVNRMQSATNVVNNQTQNLTTAEDGIRSADIGQEVANLTKYNILSSTGISALAQANQMQQSVLKLLQ